MKELVHNPMKRIAAVSGHLAPASTAAAMPVPGGGTHEPAELLLARTDRTQRPVSPSWGPHSYSAEEWELRCKLAVAYRMSAHFGWDQVVYNHITLKIPSTKDLPGGPYFLINSFGLRFDEVTAGSLLKVDHEGNVVDKGKDQGPLLKQGFVAHSAVHAARPELHCVWHCHHEDTVAVLCTKTRYLPIFQESQVVFLHGISYHPFEGSLTDLSERERLVKSLGPDNHTLLLENHGPMTTGKTVEQAFALMYFLTRSCTWQWKAMAAVGGDISKLNIPQGEDFDKYVQMNAQRLMTPPDPDEEPLDQSKAMFDGMRRMMENKYGASNIYC